MDYVPPSGAANANDPYVGKNISGGTQGSKVPRLAIEAPLRELRNAIAATGQAPTNSDLTQLTGAVGRGIWLGLLTLTLGTPNALAGTIGAPASGAAPGYVQTLQPWTKLRGYTVRTNTSSTVNVTVTGIGSPGGAVSGPLLRRDGKPLAVGDVPVGECAFQPDGTGNFLLVEPALSEMREISQSFILNKPAALILFVDPVNGNDANDGTLPGKAYKTVDAAISKTQSYVLFIYLLGDVIWSLRQNIYNNIFFQGVTADASGNITGYVTRGVNFLAEAANSPVAQGRCNSGAFLYSAIISFDHCYLAMPDQAPGVSILQHFLVQSGGNVVLSASTLATAGTHPGWLISANSAQAGGYFTLGTTISANANGYLFYGVGAGVNPNNAWTYRSNLTSG